ncbi:YgjP-like metallopeptidase domain-containing protein [Marinobacterium marinum]|uniref:M48 family metallopeptidase n=1 Tax=Marinobacterium marinum TaxID=2756129 RepID=A0A7W1WYG7_9GAMM|nr:YgjP-like metallopeptidase domain-containing protein [Marinobacterium marinum]MBA4502416.1 M48 family metallopeptidase [Marinobacterium marinum]
MMPRETLKYLNGYSLQLREQALELLDRERSGPWLLQKYPKAHQWASEKALYGYARDIKDRYMRSSAPVSKVVYDDRLHVIKNALGLHTYVTRAQGGRLKSKNEIRISSLFRRVPEPFLRMILVHELAHLREKEHGKAFYQLCCHMEQNYHQLEFELRLYLCHRDRFGDLW